MRTISRPAAYAYLLLVTGVVLYGWFAPRPQVRIAASATPRGSDRLMFDAVVQRMQRGEPYYPAMRAELEAGNYPTASPFNWRTPLHLELLSLLTVTGGRIVLAGVTLIAVALLRAGPSASPVALLAFAVPLMASTILVTMPEAWAGALIALSIGAGERRHHVAAAVCGVLAVVMRELAVVFAVGAGVMALYARRRTESLVWIAGGAAYAVYYGLHVRAVLAAMPPDAQAHTASWVQGGGLHFVFRTVECYAWALPAPRIVAPIVAAAGLLGAASSRMPLPARVSLVGYFVAFLIVGLPVNRYWGLLTVPLWGLGVWHAMDGFRRLTGGMSETDSGLRVEQGGGSGSRAR